MKQIPCRSSACVACFSPGNCEDYKSFKHCPCIKCLVKTTCGCGCDKYWKYYDKYCHENKIYWKELKVEWM